MVQAVTRLLVDQGDPAAIINAEMGTGKTMMAICAAAVMHAEGYRRCIVISPPHLVYKWRREILDTVPNARVWILNGNDMLRKLLQLRSVLDTSTAIGPEFFIRTAHVRAGYVGVRTPTPIAKKPTDEMTMHECQQGVTVQKT